MELISIHEFIVVLIYIATLILGVVINCFLFLRSKKIMLVQYFFRIQALVGFWIVAKVFTVISPDFESLRFWKMVEYFGICFFSVELLGFAYIYKYKRIIDKKVHGVLLMIATGNYLMLFTNDYHRLFFRVIDMEGTIKGPVFYFHTLFSYMLVIVSILFIVTSQVNKSYSRRDKLMLALGLAMPFFINVIYVSDVFFLPIDLTPISFNVMILSFGIAAFRSNYYEIQLMTRQMILENLYEGVIILDKDDRIIEYNRKLSEMVEPYTCLRKYSKFGMLFAEMKDFLSDYEEIVREYRKFRDSHLSETQSDIVANIGSERIHLILSLQKTYSSHGEFTGMIIKLIDMTEYHTLLEKLEDKNRELHTINVQLNENISVRKRLVIEQERNRASKEVHDILGHSVTLVITLLENVRSSFESKPEFAKEKVRQAMEVTRNGLNELKLSLTKKKESTIVTEMIIEDLNALIDEFTFSGVEVELITNHYPVSIKPAHYDTIYRICQESMTNALRHGKATRITIAVRFAEESVDIIIADNGAGCMKLVKGNGIKGMEQRVNELEGFFSCGSPDGEGFNLHVTIPITREVSNINNLEVI